MIFSENFLSVETFLEWKWSFKANFQSGKLSVDWNGQEHFSLCFKKSLVPTQSSQDKEKFSYPFQSTDNFPEWKLVLRDVHYLWRGVAPKRNVLRKQNFE
jgi:hypothetical protein